MSEEEKVLLTYDEAILLYESMYDRYENGIVSLDIDSFLKAHEYHERTCRIEHEVEWDDGTVEYGLSCGHETSMFCAPDYCPHCGAKVVVEE